MTASPAADSLVAFYASAAVAHYADGGRAEPTAAEAPNLSGSAVPVAVRQAEVRLQRGRLVSTVI